MNTEDEINIIYNNNHKKIPLIEKKAKQLSYNFYSNLNICKWYGCKIRFIY